MKKGIHPQLVACTIRCVCGNVIETRGTKPEIHVEICSSCHPFFTGRQKFVDTAGRIDRFQKRFGGHVTAGSQSKKAAKAAAASRRAAAKPKREKSEKSQSSEKLE